MADWFTAKRFGYGAGVPITWQGWAVTIAYLLLAIGAALLVQRSLLAFFAILIPATLGFLIITAKTTRGGWRWRGRNDR